MTGDKTPYRSPRLVQTLDVINTTTTRKPPFAYETAIYGVRVVNRDGAA